METMHGTAHARLEDGMVIYALTFPVRMKREGSRPAAGSSGPGPRKEAGAGNSGLG